MHALTSPGPRTLLSVGLKLQKDPLKTYESIHKTFGDIAWLPWLNRESLFLYHPDHVRHVLKDKHTNYIKSEQYEFLKPLLGEGLLTSEGDLWRKERRIMAREFHHDRLNEYAKSIHRLTERSLSKLPAGEDAKLMDVSQYFSELTFQIAGEVFFGAGVEQFGSDVNASLDTELDIVSKRIRRAFNVPLIIPTPENRASRFAKEHLDAVVDDILETDSKDRPQNVLSRLKEATPALAVKQIRDEVMTLLLAGHETTSNALMWTVFHLAKHPDWQAKILGEIKFLNKEVTDLVPDDLAFLPILKTVLLESMRLCPPIPAVARKSVEEDEIGGFHIPAGTSIVCQQWITHRDPRFWPDPLAFNPERFKDRDMRQDYSYFPFAKGPRACIGEELSMTEGMLILARLVEEYEWKLKDGFEPQMVHHLTLKSKNGMWVAMKKR